MITQIDELYQSINHPLQQIAERNGIQVKVSSHYLDFLKDNQIIRISLSHFIYSNDIINSFEYYFSAVEPMKYNNSLLVDYSTPRYHQVHGFELMPVYFPSLSEPLTTTKQYLDFADIKTGDVVLDLGAYSGLTSILFKELAGSTGQVVAIDADEKNINAINKNLSLYNKLTGNHIDAMFGAVWNHDRGLEFSSEGNMGSSATEIVGTDRGSVTRIPSFTLSQIADINKMSKISFMKCDVEGAEAVIFEDANFFKKHNPKIIIETHLVNNIETTDKCIATLQAYGYTCRRILQTGVTLPLLECYPITSQE